MGIGIGGVVHMGKKVQPARKKNYRMQPVGPAFIEPEDHEAVCPHCHGAFSVGGIVVDGDVRMCPLCAGPLDAGAFDEEAMRQIESAQAYRALVRKRNRLIGYVKHASIWKVELIGRLTFPIRRRIRKWIHRRFDPQLKELGSRWVPLDRLAESRYLCSAYFDETRTPLVFPAKFGGYELCCAYGPDGSFIVGARENPAWRKGFMAEVAAFDVLRSFAATPAVCDGSEVLANLYFPKHQESCVFETGSYFSQVDMVLLTCRAAYVFEVKSRCKEVRWDPRRDGATGGGKAGRRLAGALGQLADHAYVLQQNIPAYPYERVYEVLLYAEVDDFASAQSFVDNVIVADIRGCELSCAGAIEQVERELEPLMTAAELRDVATTVRERFGDRDLRKRQMHLMRLGRKYA